MRKHTLLSIIIGLLAASCSGGGSSTTAVPVPSVSISAPETAQEGDVLSLSTETTNLTEPVTFAWSQTVGPEALLDDTTSATASAALPLVSEPTEFVFNVTATGASGSTATSSYAVTASPAEPGSLVEVVTEWDDEQRTYSVYTPEELADNAEAVVLLHGLGGSMRTFIDEGETPRRWLSLADQDGFILIIPNGSGLGSRDNLDDTQVWNDVTDALSDADDVGFVVNSIAQVAAARPIDLGSVFAMGRSNGGMMAMRLALDAPTDFKAIASFIGSLPDDPTLMAMSLPTPPMFIYHGTEDPIIPYEGSTGFLSGEETVAFFAVTTWSEVDPAPVAEMLPNIAPNDGCEIFRSEYFDVTGAPSLIAYVGEGGGHTIPDTDPSGATAGTVCIDAHGIDLAYDFFQSLP